MMSTRFAVSVHILTLLASKEGVPAASAWIAGSVNTNPALIRRLLSRLLKAGLTRSQMGAGGGALLARPAGSISLADVYDALGEDGVIPVHASPNPRCPVGRNIQAVLERRIDAAEAALRRELANTTIADLNEEIEGRTRS